MTRALKQIKGPDRITQDEHLDSAGAKIVTEGVLIPGRVVTADISAAGVEVLKNSICRVEVTAVTYIAFGPGDMPAVTVATDPGLKLNPGTYLIAATDRFIRASAAVVRLEVVES
ncbi:MAG: hypothetical protein DRN81_02365 [Thermoproteota archaeon]|nr:MAG: hypothetical protein DRN81_02365 [Candidatus Korarchaeota archaeon]